jgi:hypothetical protein
MGEMKNIYKMVIVKPERERLLGRPRHRLENNILMDHHRIGYEDMDWINLAWDMV